MKKRRIVAMFLAVLMLLPFSAHAAGIDARYTSVSGGSSHSVAVNEKGEVYTWGSNNSGQLGLPGESSASKPTQVTGITAVSVAAGYDFSVALSADGSVYTWGMGVNQTPVKAAISNVIAIDAGQSDIVALRADGTVWKWTYGSTPAQVSGLSRIVDISAGAGFVLALSLEGRVYAWGNNQNGQLGDGTVTNRPTPVQLSLQNIVDISAGYSHSLAVAFDGTVYAWGSNEYGQLGLEEQANSLKPVPVEKISGGVKVAAGSGTSLALTQGGKLYAWGYGEYGQIGNGNTPISQANPTQVSNLSSVEEIDCGLHHCFAVTESGVLYAWGRNQALQLGTGKNSNQDTPTRITTQLSSGSMPCGYLTTGASAWAVGDINQLFRTSMVPPMLWGSYTKQITRAEFVTLLVGMYEQVKNTTVNESGTSKFIDLEGHPLETYVRKAVNLGLLNGTSGNTISPDNILTRQECAKMLCSFLQKVRNVSISTSRPSLSFYADEAKIPDWAAPYVSYTYKNGIINGYSDGRFAPADPLTREQSLSIAFRLVEKYGWD
ncbi:S-layer homology domain-containing protein [uncultured Flavonifractor sp.]|uniref:RCC1 domain-containing protein n=1 Tax=uncultured Flavonifractor sp. TaxID=1193534 RepID=UPI00261664CD|nr:S-layer homology domain-containing protein [uncultured Flavonifractor sp.]